MLDRLLTELTAGRVRLVVSEEPEGVLRAIDAALTTRLDGPETPQIVGCIWQSPPLLADLISDVLDALAETALACWPNWYAASPLDRFDLTQRRDPDAAEFLTAATLRSARIPILEPWLNAAVDCCRAGRAPRPSGLTDVIQAAQLALAIDPSRLVLLLVVTETEQTSERLDGLARAADWIARATQAPVAVIVPKELSGDAGLDSISFNALKLDWPERVTGLAVSPVANAASRSEDTADHGAVAARHPPAAGVQPSGTDDGPKAGENSGASPNVSPPRQPTASTHRSTLFVRPLQGVPHPRSEGEQRLAARLKQDEELAALFEFNRSVQTCRDTVHMVDLLWRAGRVIVEIDGFNWHSSREMFGRDRQRDYELTISGFLVLRMTHEEVVRDVELAVEKVRDLVRFRRGNGVQDSARLGSGN